MDWSDTVPPAWTVVGVAVTDWMIGASLEKGGGGLTSWRVMATKVIWFAEMVTPEDEPAKSKVPPESNA